MTDDREQQHDEQGEPQAPEDVPGEPGAEGGSQSPATDALPGMPTEDDSPLGDTDQHSSEARE